ASYDVTSHALISSSQTTSPSARNSSKYAHGSAFAVELSEARLPTRLLQPERFDRRGAALEDPDQLSLAALEAFDVGEDGVDQPVRHHGDAVGVRDDQVAGVDRHAFDPDGIPQLARMGLLRRPRPEAVMEDGELERLDPGQVTHRAGDDGAADS